MTEASAHDEQMKYFMRTKILMSGVKKRELQCIYDPAGRVNDPTGKQPAKGSSGQTVDDRTEHKDADPAHGDIDYRRKPFRAGDPEKLNADSDQCKRPDCDQQRIPPLWIQHQKTDRRIGACDQNEDHGMIDLAEYFDHSRR